MEDAEQVALAGAETVHGLLNVSITYRLRGGAIEFQYYGNISATQAIAWDRSGPFPEATAIIRLTGIETVTRRGEATRHYDVF